MKILHFQTPDFKKQTYEEQKPINRSKKYKICDFSLESSSHEVDTPVNEILFYYRKLFSFCYQ